MSVKGTKLDGKTVLMGGKTTDAAQNAFQRPAAASSPAVGLPTPGGLCRCGNGTLEAVKGLKRLKCSACPKGAWVPPGTDRWQWLPEGPPTAWGSSRR